jgi:hypothetical protein
MNPTFWPPRITYKYSLSCCGQNSTQQHKSCGKATFHGRQYNPGRCIARMRAYVSSRLLYTTSGFQ